MLNKIEQVLAHPEFAFPALVFVRRRIEAEKIAAELKEEGHQAEFVHGDISKGLRKKYAEQLREGSLDLVVATDAWATGLDIPGLRSVIIACGGKARIGLKQRSGRGCRLAEGKQSFTIFDIGGRPSSNAAENRQKRLQRYQEGGYEVSSQPLLDRRERQERRSTQTADGMDDGDLTALLGGSKVKLEDVKEDETGCGKKKEVEPEQRLLDFLLVRLGLTFFVIMVVLIWICGIFGW